MNGVPGGGVRSQLELNVGYRFHIEAGYPPYTFVPMFLVPMLGVALRSDTINQTTLSSTVCGAATCPVTERKEQIKSSGVEPLVGLSLNLSAVDLMYQFQLNPKEPKNSLHTIGVGVSF